MFKHSYTHTYIHIPIGYICGHNTINAHALAVDVYRKKYQSKQNGVIGIVLNHDWSEPLTSAQSDVDAAQRANEFKISWFADPLMLGEYPSVMRVNVGERLPQFTSEQTKLVKGSWDVFYINHYTSMYYSSAPLNPAMGWEGDQGTCMKLCIHIHTYAYINILT